MSEQETQTQETAVPASDYTPVDQRAENIGKAKITRRPEQVRADRMYQAVMPQEPEHKFDKRIQELEATVRKGKKDREFSQLKSIEERELFTLRERRSQDEREAEHQEATREWVEGVSGELARLAELRTEFTENEGFLDVDVAAIDKALIQFRTLGADLNVAKRMLADIEGKYEAKLAKDELELEAQILGHRNKIQALKDKRKNAEPKETDYLTAEDRLYIAARDEWQAQREAGNHKEADRLREVYFNERFARGQV